MRYFVPKIFVNQHRVLEKIYNVASIREFPNVKELGTALQLNEDEIMQAAYLLKGRGFANVNRDKRPFIISCTPEGGQALLQKAILDEGKEKAKTNLLRWTQITGILIASIISVGTFLVNVSTTISNSKNIEALKTEVKFLKKHAEQEKLESGYKQRLSNKLQTIK